MERYGRRLVPLENGDVRRHLSSGEQHFYTTRYDCDCGTVLGSAHDRPDSSPRDLSRKADRHRRSGWSEAKIERWLEQCRKADARYQEQLSERDRERCNRVEDWLALISLIVTNKSTPYLGLLLHDYSGPLDSESIRITERRTISTRDLTHADLEGMVEDVIYVFRA